jgi:aryl-alcohol dehydrogenase-like predicted oxidoreductase
LVNRLVRLGELTVHQLGFGAMRLTGHGDTSWGEPKDRAEAVAVAREAVRSGVDFIDTADAYGPEVSERLLREALHPYEGIVIATKGGLRRDERRRAIPDGSPQHLRQANEASRRRLDVDCIDLYQLHIVDPRVPFEDSYRALLELQEAGKVRHIGLCNVTAEHFRIAMSMGRFVSVQNSFSVLNRSSDPVVDLCREHDVAFIPYFPIGGDTGGLVDAALESIAVKRGTTARQIGLAWLLQHYEQMIPIPGTGRREHLRENLTAADLSLGADEVAWLDSLTAARAAVTQS